MTLARTLSKNFSIRLSPSQTKLVQKSGLAESPAVKQIGRTFRLSVYIEQLQKLLSHNFNDEDIEDVEQGDEINKKDLPCFLALKRELKIWQKMKKNIPVSPSNAYKRATVLPNIRNSVNCCARSQ